MNLSMARVLSLFDGMACGRIAFEELGIEMEAYDAFEIDKYAIKVSTHNFPDIEEHGDVFKADFTQYEDVDWLIGGSPCTYWSIAQTKNRETTASGMGWELFSQYVRALREAKPKYFLYENNYSMSKEIRRCITETFGFEPIMINSALVSAQNRKRLYWVGIRQSDGTYKRAEIEQPEDRGILLKDVLDGAVAMIDKAHTIDANYYKGENFTSPNKQSGQRLMCAEPVCLRYELTDEAKQCRKAYEAHEIKHGYNELNELQPRPDGKSNTLTTVLKDNQIMEPVCFAEPVEPRCVAQRGRYPENPKLRVAGLPTEQMFEAREDGKTNTLTTVQKDNYVAEPINVTVDDKSHTLKAQYYKNGIANFVSNDGFDATAVAEPVNCTADGKAKTISASYAYKGDGEGSLKSELFPDNPIKQTSNYVAEPATNICQVGSMPRPDGELSTSAGFRIYSTEAKARYLCANGGGAGAKTGVYAIPTMLVREATFCGYTEVECGECVDLSMPNSKTRRGRNMSDKANSLQTSNGFYQYCAYAIEFDEDGRPTKAVGKDGKTIAVYEVRDGKITIKGKQYPIKLKDGYYIIRKLTVSECKRLQTVPEWYDFSVISNSQAYKCLGNGWTVQVIMHLIRSAIDNGAVFTGYDTLPRQYDLFEEGDI